MPNNGALLFFYAETPLHVGGSQELGAVDLPLQRERISGLPVVAGSGIKGALRQELGQVLTNGAKGAHAALFGPEPPKKGSAPWAGALTLVDARLLLFPIRSLRSGWAWLTSPLILERLTRDLETLGHQADWSVGNLTPANNDTALVSPGSKLLSGSGALLVEDLQYKGKKEDEVTRLATWLARALPNSDAYKAYPDRLKAQVAVLTDEELMNLTEHATEVVTRTKIDGETGTVETGGLWTEEVLPAETLLWSLALVAEDRRAEANRAEKEGKIPQVQLHEKLVQAIGQRPRIRLGGDQSVGRGLVGLRAWNGGV